jgi:hypothetical protein
MPARGLGWGFPEDAYADSASSSRSLRAPQITDYIHVCVRVKGIVSLSFFFARCRLVNCKTS